jgi:membrane protein implicated in regulation of membrane protease activity
MKFEVYQLALALSLLSAIVELMTTSFIFISISIGLLIVAVIQYISGDFSIERDTLILTITTTTSLVVLRNSFKKTSDEKKQVGKDINEY